VTRVHVAIGLLLMLMTAGGAGCPQFLQNYPSAGARVLPQTSTLNDVISVLNDNSSRIRSLYTTDATLSAPMSPTLRANLALERPRRFRMRAETGLTGPEFDLGSNDQLFWLWVRRLQPPAIFFCRQEQYATSAARQLIPVEPEWLVEALGIASLDPAGQHSGPYPVGKGRLEIRTQLSRPEGPMTKVTVVDAGRGWILEQHLYDAQGTRIASSMTSNHWRDPASGATLPRHVEIQWPATGFSLKLDIRSFAVNQLGGDPTQLFEMPTYPGFNPVDMGDPRFQPPLLAPQSASASRPPSPSHRGRLFR
jgi:hypothetical protein